MGSGSMSPDFAETKVRTMLQGALLMVPAVVHQESGEEN